MFAFMKKESSAGLVLIAVTILALILQNSFLTDFYTHFLHTPLQISFGNFGIAKP
ncbi:MAG: Na+/H+ antiporter NhaA, partial [Campylobacteraceae bacterium]|nr:Na+/H+ antiporter NhaA [Campylobacteraceae bacterium]